MDGPDKNARTPLLQPVPDDLAGIHPARASADISCRASTNQPGNCCTASYRFSNPWIRRSSKHTPRLRRRRGGRLRAALLSRDRGSTRRYVPGPGQGLRPGSLARSILSAGGRRAPWSTNASCRGGGISRARCTGCSRDRSLPSPRNRAIRTYLKVIRTPGDTPDQLASILIRAHTVRREAGLLFPEPVA
jgi:hypothetical protein